MATEGKEFLTACARVKLVEGAAQATFQVVKALSSLFLMVSMLAYLLNGPLVGSVQHLVCWRVQVGSWQA